MKLRQMGFFILFGIFALLLVGCSSSSSTEESEGSNESKKSEEPKGESKFTGGELHVALNTQPPSLDPHMGTATATRDAARPIFETLVTLNSKYEVQPMLAERFEQSDDGLVYKFYLRKGVKFHNGKELKAEDVVASLERWVAKAGRAKNALGEGKFEILDDYTVQLTLPQPSVGALHVLGATNQFGGIMPKEIIENTPETGITEYVGTGPFKFVEWKQDQYIHYVKNEDYQSPEGTPDGLAGKREALVDDLYINFVSDSSTRVAGMTTEQYDIGIMMPVDSYDQLKSTKNLKNEIALSSGAVIVFNKKQGPLSDPAMRQAFNMGLDYDEIMLAAFTSPEFYRLSPGIMFPEQTDWYTDAGKENYNPNNPELAKKMFKEAGYNGEAIKILTTRDYEYMYNSALVVQAQLEKIGVKVKLDVVDWPTLMQLYTEPSSYDAFTTGFSTVTDPTQHLIFDPTFSGWNDDAKTADLIAKIRTSTTPAEAFPYWEELQEHTWTTQLPYIRFGDMNILYTYNDNVEGFKQFEGVVLWNVGKR
ncbi:ABC transporter substrate-binding protein [Cytobacillus depressus]|uniref:ABC transporter substrate-binding protein n=1 Tax=Cytobacillus depressus TaxID=1602942 RepID=A0A6L3VAD0_9BACI|nr:ABC transporter substrate-binding protein [Cytobacillus depressus]KAB2338570.1 ABC transporter substrate-binding protein [Cytobacillus depressus]